MMNPAEFENIARVEDSFWWFDGMHRIVLSLMKQVWGPRPGRVLEVGCGTGGFATRLLTQFDGSLHLCDLAPEAIRHARQRGFLDVFQTDARYLPFADDAYDCLLSLDVIVHLPRGAETDALKEFARVLKPGGLLILRVSALNILRSRHSEFTLERQRFTRRRLRKAVEACRLEPVRCTYVNSLLLPLALFKFRIWEPLLQKPPASGLVRIPQWADKLLRAALNAECAMLTAGCNFPIGQSLLLIARKPLSVPVCSTTGLDRPSSNWTDPNDRGEREPGCVPGKLTIKV